MRRRRFEGKDERQLCREYGAGATVQGLAAKHGTTGPTVRATLVRNGIEIRPPSGKPPTKLTAADRKRIVVEYRGKVSQDDLARKYRVHWSRISEIVGESGEHTGNRGRQRTGKRFPNRGPGRRGPGASAWKGGRLTTSQGYIMVRLNPDDPITAPMEQGKTGYALEHRVVMARHLGRSLESHESVHHINGDRADNRLENLQLRSGKHGSGCRLRCRACGSTDIEAVPL